MKGGMKRNHHHSTSPTRLPVRSLCYTLVILCCYVGRASLAFQASALPYTRPILNDNNKNQLIWKKAAQDGSVESLKPPRIKGLSRLWEEINALPDDREKTLYLVRLGDEYLQKHPEASSSSNAERGGRRVPGCVSVVHMWCHVNEDRSQIFVKGTSDARVSMGLVALAARGLSGAKPRDILDLDANDVAKALGLRSSLTPGRQNGLANIIKAVQQEVQALLLVEEEEDKEPKVGSKGESKSDLVLPIVNSFTEEVAVLLSGGVDSSVALNLLLKQGLKPRAFYLKIWLEDEVAHLNQCPWEEDWAYAEAVCRQANVPLEAVPLQKEYWDQVVTHTVKEAKAGRTPNPDILCNSLVKFGVFYDAIGKHFDQVATGHYARTERPTVGQGGPVRLMRSPDRVKDQTYFLSRLRQDQLARAIFPIGKYNKPEIRELASQLDLPTKTRKDSQGICFLGKLRFDDFLRHYLGEAPGDVVWLENDLVIGQHRGLWFHTIGQRKGIVPVLGNSYRPLGPWYVAAKDPSTNVLYVTNSPESLEGDEARLTFRVNGITWISESPPPLLAKTYHSSTLLELPDRGNVLKDIPLEVQIRHGPNAHAARVRALSSDCTSVEVTLPNEDSPAPGQYTAFYDGLECLGAGVISEESWAVPQGPARMPIRR